jgi:hypothetical protein
LTLLSKKMNFQIKNRKVILLIVLFCIIGLYIFYSFPWPVNKTYDAVEYQAGNMQVEKPVKVSIDGYYYKKIILRDKFTGTVIIDGDKFKISKLVVDSNGELLYGFNESTGSYYSYGVIYVNKGMNKITICIDKNSGWNSGDGYIISAPSKSRAEALNITNDLLSKYLVNKIQ